jgi:membrane protein
VSRAINRAWGTAKSRPFYISKIRYFAMCIGVALLFLLSAAVTGFVEVVVGFDLPLLDRIGLTEAIARAGSRVASFVFLLSMFGLLYKVMPRVETRWREVWAGALLAGVLLELGKAVFVRYLEDVANFEAVYGSLSTAIILLLWLYVSAWILILGAEFIYVRRNAKEEAA